MPTDTRPETADAPTQPKPVWLSLLNENLGESLAPDDEKEDLEFTIGTMVREYLLHETNLGLRNCSGLLTPIMHTAAVSNYALWRLLPGCETNESIS
jgi:hypothetical protein